MSWICGVEEAGRGPVIGPMIMVAAWTSDEEQLSRIGIKDSKQLLPQARELAYEKLKKLKAAGKFGYIIKTLSTKEIDDAVNSATDNLNNLELRTTADLANQALAVVKIEELLVDSPTRNVVKYSSDIKRLLKKPIPIRAENKADENYPIVAAASIIAKVERDRAVQEIARKIGINFGSGYPSDPKTRSFLEKYHKDETILPYIRKSWQSYKNLLEGKQQKLENFSTGDLGKFELLKEHGFSSIGTKSPYEVFRLQGEGAVVIKYSTGKVIVQGVAQEKVERLLKELGL